MAITYSTRVVHPRDRVTYWREVVLKNLSRHEFRSSVGPAFRGDVRFHMLADLGVAVFDCDPCEVARTQRDLAYCDSDDFMLSLQLAGQSVMSQDDRQAISGHGTFALFDTLRPCTISLHEGTKCLAFKIPRRALEARLGSLAALTAYPMGARDPLSGLVSGFVAALPDHIDAFDTITASKIAEQTLDLVALAYSAKTERRVIALSSPRAIALLRLKLAIKTNLCDPDLKPATAAAAAGMSVRYANELLSQEGTSLERYILRRRLECCRSALGDPAQAHRMIGDIAFGWGFSDLSHFGRRFRAEFGLSPRDYREQVKKLDT